MNSETLAQLSWENWQPMRLSVAGAELSLQRCLRLLPGKRMACKASYNSRAVFAKVCFHKGHRREVQAEAEKLRQLADAGVRVPAIHGVLQTPDFTVLLLEWLDHAQPLGQVPPSQWSAALADDFCAQLNAMYAAHLMQSDLHLDNFLQAGSGLYVVDAGAVQQAPGKVLSVRRRRNNLALLCAQAPVVEQESLLRLVLERMAGHIDTEHALRRAVRKQLMRRIRHANGKWLRNCSAVQVTSATNGRTLLDRSVASSRQQRIQSLLASPDQAELLKSGSRISVYRDADLVIKHYRQASLKTRLKQVLGIHPAQRSWRYGWTWRLLGLPTPQPLALALAADGSAVLVFPCQAGERYSEVLEYQRDQGDQLRPQLQAHLQHMGQARLWHGDVKAQNILVDNGQASWIDLDAAGWSRWHWRAARKHDRDVQRFARNWDQFVDRRGGQQAQTDDTGEADNGHG